MKITVGKAYEGASSQRLEDGDYELQITEITSTKGRVNMTLTTSTNQHVYKTFFLLEKDSKTPNERGMRELADYITTAMQIEEEQVQVDTDSALGFYLLCYVKNGSYQKETESGEKVEKRVYNVYSPRRCSGFSDGTPSFVAGAPSYVAQEAEDDVQLPFDTPETPDVQQDDDQPDIFKRLGV